MCTLCCDNKIATEILPCHHKIMCFECSKSLKSYKITNCPICRSPIGSIIALEDPIPKNWTEFKEEYIGKINLEDYLGHILQSPEDGTYRDFPLWEDVGKPCIRAFPAQINGIYIEGSYMSVQLMHETRVLTWVGYSKNAFSLIVSNHHHRLRKSFARGYYFIIRSNCFRLDYKSFQ